MSARFAIAVLTTSLILPSPALAGWTLMPGNKPANVDGLAIGPLTDWNQASSRPGKFGRTWTQDGFALNAIEFFAGVPNGATLYKERNRKQNPMPRFDNKILLPELADFFERSFRASNQLSDFELLESIPITFSGSPGLKVSYRYTLPNDELSRLGEARLAVVKGKLYMANYYAPRLHYFDARLQEAHSMMETAKF